MALSPQPGVKLQLDEVGAAGGGGRGSGIQLAIRNAQNVLGTYPGLALDTAGLLMGQIALVRCQTSS